MRVPVVPLDQLARRVHAAQLLARHAKPAVSRRTVRQQHGRVVRAQLLQLQRRLLRPRGAGSTDVHITKVSYAAIGLALDLLESIRHILDVLVVGCDAEAHEAKGHRKLLEDVHVHVWIILEQMVSSVECGRP